MTQDDWPPETFWCAIKGGKAFCGGKSRKELGEARLWAQQHYGVPEDAVWVTSADTAEEADAYFARYWEKSDS